MTTSEGHAAVFTEGDKARLLERIAGSAHAPGALAADGLEGLFVALAIAPDDPEPDEVVAAALDTDAPTEVEAATRDDLARWRAAAAVETREALANGTLTIGALETRTGRLDYAGWAGGFLDGAALGGMLDEGDPEDVDELLFPFRVLAGAIDPRERANYNPAKWRTLVRECEVGLAAQVARLASYWAILLAPPSTFRREQAKVGRNDPCPCGSGRKFKQCHGRATAT